MAYGRRQKRNAHVRVGGARSTALVYAESSTQLDSSAQTDAISPNFIHALDAAALVFALDAMQREGISGVGVIHDCAGGLATEMITIAKAVRGGFATLHQAHDPLRAFYEAAFAQVDDHDQQNVAEPPASGEYNADLVLTSRYFFS